MAALNLWGQGTDALAVRVAVRVSAPPGHRARVDCRCPLPHQTFPHSAPERERECV